jgi:hypothetical protein
MGHARMVKTAKNLHWYAIFLIADDALESGANRCNVIKQGILCLSGDADDFAASPRLHSVMFQMFPKGVM